METCNKLVYLNHRGSFVNPISLLNESCKGKKIVQFEFHETLQNETLLDFRTVFYVSIPAFEFLFPVTNSVECSEILDTPSELCILPLRSSKLDFREMF